MVCDSHTLLSPPCCYLLLGALHLGIGPPAGSIVTRDSESQPHHSRQECFRWGRVFSPHSLLIFNLLGDFCSPTHQLGLRALTTPTPPMRDLLSPSTPQRARAIVCPTPNPPLQSVEVQALPFQTLGRLPSLVWCPPGHGDF